MDLRNEDHRHMLQKDHWLNCPNTNRLTLFHSLHCWPHPLSLRSVSIILSKHWHYTLSISKVKIKNGRGYVTYSSINSVFLLKTPGGSSFIWLLSKSLRKHIPTLIKIVLPLYMLLLLNTFFGPGHTNAFTVILNVIEQIDTYQHFKYGTISVLKAWTYNSELT